MKKITEKQLKVILKKHALWTSGDPKGCRADLRGANLREANLCRADLRGANLCGANLCGADLRGASLCRADLGKASLCSANLWGADLRGANLREANLWRANLRGADLREANLWRANLRGAGLREANLWRANLWGADLWGADLWGADLRDVLNMSLPIACPEEGAFIGFKKCAGDYIVKLRILEDALRCSATSRKCRCSKAEVISITNLDGSDASVDRVSSSHDATFVYRIGEIVSVDNFNTDRWNECSTGIHFFITRQEAVEY